MIASQKTLSDEMDSAPAAWRPRDGARLALHATSVEELRSGLRREYGAELLDVAAEGAGERFVSCLLPWKSITFEYCFYGAQTRVAFPKIKQVRQQYCLRGAGQAVLGGDAFPINPAETCVINPDEDVVLELGRGMKQVVAWIDPEALVRKRAALIGTAPDLPLALDRSTRFDSPDAQALRRLIDFIVQQLTAGTPLPKLVADELEQTLITHFLLANQHNFRALLEKQASHAGPWQVRMAEEYIDANWDKPITLELLSGITGASTRSLHEKFKQARGYSPMAFAKQVRLKRARELLLRPAPATSVTTVSSACGFSNLGHFAKDYFKIFGERPSETLARSYRRTG
jgi:AraC-like DNA-binding protein